MISVMYHEDCISFIHNVAFGYTFGTDFENKSGFGFVLDLDLTPPCYFGFIPNSAFGSNFGSDFGNKSGFGFELYLDLTPPSYFGLYPNSGFGSNNSYYLHN